MKTLLLDDEPFALQYLETLCLGEPRLAVVATFTNAPEALDYLADHAVDLVITDIEMPGLTGIEAVARLRDIQPGVGVIFVTGYEEYALEAFRMEAVAYILKPCSREELGRAVRRAAMLSAPQSSVTVRTLGYFMVSISGVPVRFSNSKAKELLALLVDRNGASVTIEQAVEVLWEDRRCDDTVKRLYRKAVGYLHQMFGGTGFFVSERGSCHVVPARVDCDYFTLLRDPAGATGLYTGEYLTEYSWAEPTNGRLTRLLGGPDIKE